MDTYDIILAVVKFASIIAACVFGTLGIVHDVKDENKKITRWGCIAIGGVIISALLSTGSQAIEVYKARIDQAERYKRNLDEVKRANALLYELKRNMELIDVNQLSFDFGLFFSINDPAFDNYRQQLGQVYDRLKAEADGGKKNLIEKTAEKLSLLRIKDRDVLTLYPGSPYWPTNHTEEKDILRGFGAILQLKNPKERDSRDDLMIALAVPFDDKIQIRNFDQAKLSYDTKTQRISVHITGARSLSPISASQVFLSVVDFEGVDVSFQPLINSKNAPSVSLGEFRMHFGSNLRHLIADKSVIMAITDDDPTFTFKLVSRWYDNNKTANNKVERDALQAAMPLAKRPSP